MFRAFICAWSIDRTGARPQVVNPILTYLDENEIGIPVSVSYHYPSATGTGEPDKPLVLAIARQPTGVTTPSGQTIEAFGNLSGVYMLPPYRFSKPIAEIPATVRNEIRDAIVARGVPLSALAGMDVYGDFLRKVAKYFDVNHKGFGRHYEVDADAEFDDG